MTSFECTKSVFNITNENTAFSITLRGTWNFKSAEKTADEHNKLLDFRYQNDIDLHVEQVRKEAINLINDYSLSSLDIFKN